MVSLSTSACMSSRRAASTWSALWSLLLLLVLHTTPTVAKTAFATSSNATTLSGACHATSMCTMASGLTCNRTVGGCPPCLYTQTANTVLCVDKAASPPGCPSLPEPLLADCETEKTASSSTTTTTAPLEITRAPEVLQATLPTAAASQGSPESTTIILVVVGAVVLVGAVMGFVIFQRRRRRQLNPNNDRPRRVEANREVVIKSKSVEQNPPIIVMSNSSVVSSEADGDIMSTMFMRFRSTSDYAADERHSVFSECSTGSSDFHKDGIEI
ncbi:hypothetical protein AC1031_013781 [Aphanomyces cochlioides]|nr:hypothetical protein AC1031_013781 [Aphanomyces cochlioides]